MGIFTAGLWTMPLKTIKNYEGQRKLRKLNQEVGKEKKRKKTFKRTRVFKFTGFK